MRAAVLAVVAVVVRLVPVMSGGGLLYVGRYDDGVYFAAGAALLDGRMPYRDFVLLHPPLIAVALAPFALLGRLTSDPVGLAAARVVWMALGVVATLAVARLADGWGRRAGWAAGLLYACSVAAARPEQATYIEPLGDLLLLGALLVLTRTAGRRGSPRRDLAVGVLLGLTLTGKIWYVVPVGIVLVWVLVQLHWRAAVRIVLATAVVAAAVLLPFFVLAPRRMWQLVVVDQLTRLSGPPTSLGTRLSYLLGTERPGVPQTATDVLTWVLAAAWCVAFLACLGPARARLVALVALGELVVLLVVPVFIAHYAHLTAAPAVLVLVIGWTRIARARPIRAGPVRRRALAAAGLGLVALALVGAAAFVARPTGRTIPVAAIQRALPAGCIASDDPTVLAVVDRLSADLEAGCPVAVDVTGDSYGSSLYRTENPAYQRRLLTYLGSGSAAIVRRRVADGLTPQQVRGLGRTVLRPRHLRVLLTGRAAAPPSASRGSTASRPGS